MKIEFLPSMSITLLAARSSSSSLLLGRVVSVSTLFLPTSLCYLTAIGEDCFPTFVSQWTIADIGLRNPQADLQAMDRAHRIGQTKQVYVFRFITQVSRRSTRVGHC